MKNWQIKILAIAASLLITTHAFAARGWFIKNAHIIKVSSFWDGTNNVLQVSFSVDPSNVDTTNVSCAATWSSTDTATTVEVLTNWNTTAPNNELSAWYSTALAAQAQGLPVDLYVNNGTCSTAYGNSWGGISIPTPLS